MGMYTDITDCDVKIVDMVGLVKFLKDIKEEKLESYKNDSARQYPEAVKIDGEYLDFYEMSGWKIISYWYDEMVMFLRDVAVFVEGFIYLHFETDDEGGYIEFKDGKCIIHTGVMNWSKTEADEFGKIPEMSKELKERLCARNI